jgi:hypothetical protein
MCETDIMRVMNNPMGEDNEPQKSRLASEMTADSNSEPSTPSEPTVRLEFGAVVRRVALLVLLIQILNFWLPQRGNRRGFRRRRRLRNMLAITPLMVMISFVVGSVVAVLSYLLVRFVVQPFVRVWYNPRSDGGAGSFHLAPSETVEASTPARRAQGRRWQPGTLVRTNQRLWFFPISWDSEPWSVPLDETHDSTTEPAPKLGLGFVTGLPDRVSLRDGSGQVEQFAVPNPGAVLPWWCTQNQAVSHEQPV